MKMYGVKEIEEYTVLSRKDLFVYKKSIPPVERKGNAGFNAKGREHKGYKLYDQEGLEKLCMAALFKKLGAAPKRINELDKDEAQVEKLMYFAVEVLGLDWGRFLSGQANSLAAVDTYIRDIEKRTRRGLPEFIADAIFVYQINHFLDEGENTIEDLEKCIGMDYSEERVKGCLEQFMMLLSRWFGYRNYAEGESIISKLKLQFKQEGDMKGEVRLMDYICGAMKYYGDVG